VVINGSGSQLGPSPRWGDYTSLNIDPTDGLHLLVCQRVLRGVLGERLADKNRQFPIAGVLT
jgi:hypothetical protein